MEQLQKDMEELSEVYQSVNSMVQEQGQSIDACAVNVAMADSNVSHAEESLQSASKKQSTGAGIFISVRLPGRVVETNGIADSFAGDISWSFYPEAAAFGDLTLTATCDTDMKPDH